MGTRVRVLEPEHFRGKVGVVGEMPLGQRDCVVQLGGRADARYAFDWNELEPIEPAS